MMLRNGLLAYAVQSRPLGWGTKRTSIYSFLNAAEAMFLATHNLKRTLVTINASTLFNQYTSLTKLVHLMIRTQLWSFQRLPINGLSSVVFDHLSPTWCIANGNIWFHHADFWKSGCVQHDAVLDLLAGSERFSESNKNHTLSSIKSTEIDWKHYFRGQRVCVRLNEHGFHSSTIDHFI